MRVRARSESVVIGRDREVLQQLLDDHARPGGQVLDVTANARRMWEGVRWDGLLCFMDIDPEMQPDIVGDFRAIPWVDESVDVIVFDPPHLPSDAASANSNRAFVTRFGLQYAPKGDNIASYFPPFLAEAHRVLRPGGMIFAKLCDFVHNHAYQWMLVDFVIAVRATPGLTACNLRIKRDPNSGRLMSGTWKSCHHPRNTHAWWVAVRKGRCEPAGV